MTPMNLARLLPALVLGVACFTDAMAQSATDDWPAYGRDPGGARYSPLADIDRSNVASARSRVDFPHGTCLVSRHDSDTRFETTPIVVDGSALPHDAARGADRARPRDRRRALALRSEIAAQCGLRRFCQSRRQHLARCEGAAGLALPAPDLPRDHRRAPLRRGRRHRARLRDFGARGMIDLRKGLRHAPSSSPPTR